MIKKLRIKFVIISMISILIVLVIIMAGINISNYTSVSGNADNILNMLYETDGKFNIPADFNPGDNRTPREINDENIKINENENRQQNPEMIYETRYFSVTITKDSDNNKSYSVFIDNIKAVKTEDEAINYANNALNHSSKKGYIGVYRYLYGTKSDGSILVVFIDCTRGLDNARSFLFASLIISAIGYVCVFILILLASKYVFKPVDEAYQKQKRFISNASHELKTPLTIISANNELIEMIHGSDESTDAINRQIKRLNQMVSSLSLLTKLSEYKKLDKTEVFNLSDSINDIIVDLNISNNDNIKVETNIQPNLNYNGNEGLIRQLISIILDNAIKYSESFITIHAYIDQKAIIFECMNDCYEIEDGIHNEVFERFYRNDNIRSKKEGSGIGLSIAKEIVELHKSQIVASSVNNTFKIKIILN